MRCDERRDRQGRGVAVSLVVSLLVVAAAVVLAAGAMVLVRRFAPEQGWFADSNLGAAVFGFLGTAFAVALAFVILLAMQSYSTARQAAAQEAVAVTQLFRTTALMPGPASDALRGALACYGRAVAADEWQLAETGRESARVQGWLDDMGVVVAGLQPDGVRETAAFGQWFDQDTDRRDGRRTRLLEAQPLVPPFLWAVLLLSGLILIGYVMLFAAKRERLGVQLVMAVSVTAMIGMGLVLVGNLDRPYRTVQPDEMTRTLALMQTTRLPSAEPLVPPCDAEGVATR